MADYYPLLRKAIDRLDQPSEAARYNVYERARQALVHQLRSAGFVDKQLDEHLESLDRAVAQIEREFANVAQGADARSARGARRAGRQAGAVMSHRRRRRKRRQQQNLDEPRNRCPARNAQTIPLRCCAGGARSWLRGFCLSSSPPLSACTFSSRGSVLRRPTARPLLRRRVGQRPLRRPLRTTQEAAQPSYILRRQRVFYRTTHPPNTIAVSLSQKFLYVVQPNQVAIRYTIGVGPACDKVAGLFHVTEKVPRPADSATGRAPTAPVMPAQHFSPPALYFDQGRAVHEAADPKAVGQLVRSRLLPDLGAGHRRSVRARFAERQGRGG